MIKNFSKYLVIGNGRVAKHFLNYLSLLDIPFEHWHLQSYTSLNEVIKTCSHVLLAIPDAAIEKFYKSHPVLHEKTSIHFSGALSIPGVFGAHPLMTFTHNLYDLEIYKKIFFVIENNSVSFEDILPYLPNRYTEISKEKKSFYHALCVMGGNFPVIMWKKMITEFELRLGIPREAVWPFLEKVLAEFEKDPQNSLTGPITRGDWSTVEKNLESLKGDDFKPVYEALLGV